MSLRILSITAGNFASKAAGLIREVLFAGWFGTGDTAAAFRIAQTAYLLPSQALVGDTLGGGLLPLYKKMLSEGGEEPRLLLMIAAAYGLAFAAVITASLWFAADAVAALVAPGANAAALTLASKLLRILSLATPFFILSNLLGYVEAAHGHYGAIAWRSMFLNFGSIGGAALAVWTGHDHWLATAILLSYLAFFTWTFLAVQKLVAFMPEASASHAMVRGIARRFLRNILPLIGLPLLAQSGVIVERIVASRIGTNVIPSVDYARVLAESCVQLIAVPLGVLTMSVHGGSDSDAARRHVQSVTGVIMLLTFPLAAFISLNAEAIVTVVFARGAFDAESVRVTASILRWMGGCLGATVTGYYLIRALNSQLRNVDAFAVTALAAVTSMAVNLLLWRDFGAQTIGMASAASSAMLMSLALVRLKLVSETAPVLAWVASGIAIQVAASLITRHWLAAPSLVIADLVVAVTLWSALIAAVPVLRRTASPLVDGVLRRLVARLRRKP